MSTEKKRYAVLGPLKVGDKRIDPVEGKVVTVELTDAEAEDLTALGVVGDAPAKPAKSEKQPKPGTGDDGKGDDGKGRSEANPAGTNPAGPTNGTPAA